MATTTQNLGLIKPAGTDKIRIAQINSNMDTLDAKIGAVGSTSLQEQLNEKNLKTYYLGSQLGLTGGNYKPLDIVTALPNHSIFMSAPGTSAGDLAAVGTGANEWPFNGTVLVFKDNPTRHIVLSFYGTASNSSIQKFAWTRAYIPSGSSTYDAMMPWTVQDDGSSLAIVAADTTAPQAIASGQYVVWKGSLYTANSNIASGATLSTSNLTAVSNGGLNDLNGQIDSLNSNFAAFMHTVIEKNTDLNNIDAAGLYDSQSATVSSSLINCPLTSIGFVMLVMKKGTYCTQIIFQGSANIYTRTRTSNGWLAWYVYNGTAVS